MRVFCLSGFLSSTVSIPQTHHWVYTCLCACHLFGCKKESNTTGYGVKNNLQSQLSDTHAILFTTCSRVRAYKTLHAVRESVLQVTLKLISLCLPLFYTLIPHFTGVAFRTAWLHSIMDFGQLLSKKVIVTFYGHILLIGITPKKGTKRKTHKNPEQANLNHFRQTWTAYLYFIPHNHPYGGENVFCCDNCPGQQYPAA